MDIYDELSLSNKAEVYSNIKSDILDFRSFRHNQSSDKFRNEYYRIIQYTGYDVMELEDKFNMLHYDGFVFKKSVPVETRDDKKSLTLLIFVRKSEYK